MTNILTTHVGSLPRKQDVVDMIFAREHGQKFDQAEFDRVMQDACAETVKRQRDSLIDIVSDGETSKISYATYVKDRYTGFSGDSPRNPPGDLEKFPTFLRLFLSYCHNSVEGKQKIRKDVSVTGRQLLKINHFLFLDYVTLVKKIVNVKMKNITLYF